MKLPRRKFLHLTAAATALPGLSRIAWAQSYPSRPVRWIVGYPAGGPSDISARIMAQSLSERLNRPFIIENRPGANSHVATEVAVRAQPDGYTLIQISLSNAFNATLYDNLSFDLTRDIAPVASFSRTRYVMVVNPSVPAKTGSGVHSVCQSQPRSHQHVVGREWEPTTRFRRAVQGDGRRQHAPCTVSRRGTRTD